MYLYGLRPPLQPLQHLMRATSSGQLPQPFTPIGIVALVQSDVPPCTCLRAHVFCRVHLLCHVRHPAHPPACCTHHLALCRVFHVVLWVVHTMSRSVPCVVCPCCPHNRLPLVALHYMSYRWTINSGSLRHHVLAWCPRS